MKIIVFIAAALSCSYFILSWTIDNPHDAKKLTRQVDSTADTLLDKGQRVVEQIKK